MTDGAADQERERLRDVLGFPESTGEVKRPSRGGRAERQHSEPADVAPAIDDYFARRFDQLSQRVETLTGLVEKLVDRFESSMAGAFSAVSEDDLADFAARMVRLTEDRNAHLPTDIKEARRDLQRFDRSVVDLQAAIVNLPAQVAMPERVRQEIHGLDQPLRDLQNAMDELSERVDGQLREVLHKLDRLSPPN